VRSNICALLPLSALAHGWPRGLCLSIVGAMRDRPPALAGRALAVALADGWRIDAVAVRYDPVGGGSYHWRVRDGAGRRWFVTVDDLDHKPWLGTTREVVFGGLRAALDAARALRADAGLRFVIAPVPALDGQTVRPLGRRYALAVYPFVDGAAGRFGGPVPSRDRAGLMDMLAALHEATPAAPGARACEAGLPLRGMLETALGELRRPWPGGPYAEPARALLAAASGRVRGMLDAFDQLVARISQSPRELVITHGEPHPGNVLRTADGMVLADWDTAGLASPERDLWMIAGQNGAGLDRYAAATGWSPDPAAIAMYRLRWTLDDVANFVGRLRSPHRRTPDTEHAWQTLTSILAGTPR
jgi:spectinomycin phosphotransferase